MFALKGNYSSGFGLATPQQSFNNSKGETSHAESGEQSPAKREFNSTASTNNRRGSETTTDIQMSADHSIVQTPNEEILKLKVDLEAQISSLKVRACFIHLPFFNVINE